MVGGGYWLANDRIYLICKKCKEYTTIYNYYPSGGHLTVSEDTDIFIGKHLRECKFKEGSRIMDFGGDCGFYVQAESNNSDCEPFNLSYWEKMMIGGGS